MSKRKVNVQMLEPNTSSIRTIDTTTGEVASALTPRDHPCICCSCPTCGSVFMATALNEEYNSDYQSNMELLNDLAVYARKGYTITVKDASEFRIGRCKCEESMVKKQELPAVKWVEIGADDFSAISVCKRYYFRCEDMGQFWWWRVDFLSEEIGASYFSDKPAKTRAQAMALAEQCYLAHLNKGG